MMRESYGPLGLLIKRHGFFSTQRGLTTLASAAIMVRKTGEEPTRENYRAFWNASERTSYRDMAAWKKISGDADLGEAARRVVSEYSTSILDQGSVSALAFDLVDFVPAQ